MIRGRWTYKLTAALAAVALSGAVAAMPAGAGQRHKPAPHPDPEEPITVVASGLEAPFGLSGRYQNIFVAESGSNQVVRVDPDRGPDGNATPVISDLPSPAAVARTTDGLAIVTSGADAPDADLEGTASVYWVFGDIQGPATPVADLQAYELENNPDGQLQFDPETGEPLDALSNPFGLGVAPDGRSVYVADGGANDVLHVTPDGEVTTFFVPPVVTTGVCEGRPNNDPEHAGCDPVPTGVVVGPDGRIYVSTLSAEAPGEGIVYVLDENGEILDTIGGLDSPTGVAVDDDGNIYVSEVLYGAPAEDEEPPPDFDPSTVGRIVRISSDGEQTYAAVTMPTGLLWLRGTLYASAWSTAGFLGIEGAGQVVAVHDSAFS